MLVKEETEHLQKTVNAEAILFCPWRVELGNLLGSIVIHTITVVASCRKVKMLVPFILILKETSSIKVWKEDYHIF